MPFQDIFVGNQAIEKKVDPNHFNQLTKLNLNMKEKYIGDSLMIELPPITYWFCRSIVAYNLIF